MTEQTHTDTAPRAHDDNMSFASYPLSEVGP